MKKKRAPKFKHFYEWWTTRTRSKLIRIIQCQDFFFMVMDVFFCFWFSHVRFLLRGISFLEIASNFMHATHTLDDLFTCQCFQHVSFQFIVGLPPTVENKIARILNSIESGVLKPNAHTETKYQEAIVANSSSWERNSGLVLVSVSFSF